MALDPISYILARRGLKLPTLKGLVIDTSKDWQGYRIINLGEPVSPHDAARRIYVDEAATGLGINYYFLDAADTEAPAYKQLSLTPPELTEAYAEYTSNAAGDYEIGSWIAPADSIPVLRLGVYTTHFQAERVSGGIDVRFFFRLYERDSGGTETLITESSLSDLITDRRDVITGLILAGDYVMSAGSRLVLKIYVRYFSSGPSTTVRLYYQGAVRSRLATPIAKEVLDTIYAGITHASRHALGGADELSLDASQIASGTLNAARIPGLDASKIVSGVLDVARIPDLDASKIVSGRFSLSRLPTSSYANRFLVVRTANADPVFGALTAGDIPSLDASKITSGVFDVARIPDLDASKITSTFDYTKYSIGDDILYSIDCYGSGDTYTTCKTIRINQLAPKGVTMRLSVGAMSVRADSTAHARILHNGSPILSKDTSSQSWEYSGTVDKRVIEGDTFILQAYATGTYKQGRVMFRIHGTTSASYSGDLLSFIRDNIAGFEVVEV